MYALVCAGLLADRNAYRTAGGECPGPIDSRILPSTRLGLPPAATGHGCEQQRWCLQERIATRTRQAAMNRKTARGPARPPFELIEHPADVGIRVYGRDLAALFTHAALGLCSLVTDTDTVLERETRSVEVAAPDRESLLVAWLSEVLWLIEAEDLVFARFTIESLSDTALDGGGSRRAGRSAAASLSRRHQSGDLPPTGFAPAGRHVEHEYHL